MILIKLLKSGELLLFVSVLVFSFSALGWLVFGSLEITKNFQGPPADFELPDIQVRVTDIMDCIETILLNKDNEWKVKKHWPLSSNLYGKRT